MGLIIHPHNRLFLNSSITITLIVNVANTTITMNENTDDKIDLQHLRISSLKTNSGVDKLFWNFLSIVFFIFYCKKINMMGLPKIPQHPREYANN